MKKYILYIAIILTICNLEKVACRAYSLNEKLNAYLQKQLEHELFFNDNNQKDVSVLEIEHVKSIETTEHVNIFTFSNSTFISSTFIAMDNVVYYISDAIDDFSLIKTNFSVTETNNAMIQFVKTIIFENYGFLVVGFKTNLVIFKITFETNTFQKVQTLENPEIIDVIIFVNAGNLYLSTIENSSRAVSLRVYKWMNTYFDEIISLYAGIVKSIASFTVENQELIILVSNDLQEKQPPSLLFEFNFDKLKKIQKLFLKNITHVTSYESNNTTFVLIESEQNNTIYYWNGNNLISWPGNYSNVKIGNFDIFPTSPKPILFAKNTTELLAYIPYKEEILKVDNKEYITNITKILAIHKGMNVNRTSIAFIVGLHEDNIVNINVMTFKIHSSEMESHLRENDVLQMCFINLEQKVYSDREKLNNLTQKTKTILLSNETIQLDTVDNIRRSPVFSNWIKRAEQSLVGESLQHDIQETSIDEIRNRVDEIETKISQINETVSNNSLIFEGDVTIKESLTAEILTGNDLHLKLINGYKWVPEQWLLYSVPQTITGLVDAQIIRAKQIEATEENPKFSNLLLSNQQQQTITGMIHTNNLVASKMYANQINDINFNDIYLKSKPRPIKGRKHFEKLKCDSAKFGNLNGVPPNNLLLNLNSTSPKLAPNVSIEFLSVQKINGINWNEFINSIYRFSKKQAINGNLTISALKIEHSKINTLGNINVDDFLTTTTNQIVSSHVKFNHIFTEEVIANTVNDVKLKEVVILKNTTRITNPIKIGNLTINKDLEITDNFNNPPFTENGEHIIGTNESDLLQIYSGKITILGDLFIDTLSLNPSVKMVVNKKQFNPDIISTYWTKSVPQTIPVLVEMSNGLTTSHLLTKQINGIPIDNFMLNNNDRKLFSNYSFENVTVLGNIVLDENMVHVPDLEKINRDAVKTNGSFIISGKKIFNDTLKVETLNTDVLGGIKLQGTVNMKDNTKILGVKRFENLVIKGNLLTNSLTVDNINNVNLNLLKNYTVFTDEFEIIDFLHLRNISVENITVKYLNSLPINDYISKLEQIYSTDSINNLHVTGNVVFNNILGVSTINSYDVNKVKPNNLKLSKSGSILGSPQFTGTTKIEDLIVAKINDVDFKTLTTKFLYKNYDQQIFAPHTFTNLKTVDLLTSYINNVSVEYLIDVWNPNLQEIFAPNGLRFKSTVQLRSVSAHEVYPCNFNEAYQKLRYQPTQDLSTLIVYGNVTFMQQDGVFKNIFDNAVVKNSPATFTVPVKLESISAQNIFTQQKINGINLQEIFDDALLSDSSEEQIVGGRKVFWNMHASSAQVEKNADIPTVNNITVEDLDKSILLKNQFNGLIKGKKTFFNGLQSKRFHADTIGALNPNVLVSSENPQIIPNAIFDSLTISQNLNTNFVNNIDLNLVLNDRLLCKSSEKQIVNATYYFENLIVKGNLQTPFINDINISDVVFDVNEQEILAAKHFLGNVSVVGEVEIDSLNGNEVSKIFEKAVLFGETTKIDGSITILRPAKLQGNIQTNNINGYPLSKIKEILSQGTTKEEADGIRDVISLIESNIRECIPMTKNIHTEFKYVEKSSDIQISISKTISAKTIETNGHVLLHINGEEDASYCGLPNNCFCPVQHTIEISPAHSINEFINKGFQRVFTYSNDDVFIHFMTNSISTSEQCRVEKQNNSKMVTDISHMTWNTIGNANRTGSFNIYQNHFSGYVSGVEFFSVRDTTYIVVGRYYEPELNTYDLDCIVLRFNKDRTDIEEIQRLKTKGAWTLYLFHTAQGVTLIVGNTKSERSESPTTQIYRFDEINEEFKILREIPSTGCTAATGIVLGIDSFIALANKNDLVQDLKIFKYNSYYDNYYYYQSFQLGAPVHGISVFYTGGFGISDAYMCIVTEYNYFFIYSYKYLEGWKLESNSAIDGLRNLIPFRLNKKLYLFAPSTEISSLLTVIN